MATRQKAIEYRRARWYGASTTKSLEKIVRGIWSSNRHHLDRRVQLDQDTYIIGMNEKNYGPGGFAVAFARYEHNQSIGTLPMNTNSTTAIGAQAPNPGTNYLQNGFLAVIRDNHVVGMNLGRNGASLVSYMFKLAGQGKLGLSDAQFELVRVAALDKVALMMRHKVKSIDLESSISEIALHDLQSATPRGTGLRGHISTALSATGAAFKAVMSRNDDAQGLMKSRKGNIKLSISVPSSDLVESRESLEEVSKQLVEDESEFGFQINLGDGKTVIRPGEIAVGKSISVAKDSNFIELDEAFTKMYSYMEELDQLGYLTT